jgi:small ubiquitin-related modifier
MAEEGSSSSIQLKVKNAEGKEVLFKLKMTTPLRKLMDAYCQREGLPVDGVRFLYDGERVNRDQTPEELDMQDGDEIDALVEQTGGAHL